MRREGERQLLAVLFAEGDRGVPSEQRPGENPPGGDGVRQEERDHCPRANPHVEDHPTVLGIHVHVRLRAGQAVRALRAGKNVGLSGSVRAERVQP